MSKPSPRQLMSSSFQIVLFCIASNLIVTAADRGMRVGRRSVWGEICENENIYRSVETACRGREYSGCSVEVNPEDSCDRNVICSRDESQSPPWDEIEACKALCWSTMQPIHWWPRASFLRFQSTDYHTVITTYRNNGTQRNHTEFSTNNTNDFFNQVRTFIKWQNLNQMKSFVLRIRVPNCHIEV